ncbi:hypothetical protein D3879_14595 [Pseudomonas cavernicola]|uniref:DUF2460 domain-containing protein n=1 Tax=Pseudomonas cavernicola TaxID=2320866 RepID=A0A418XES7_9PSED|nr:DUF2460 domain-containing protein [Pseudomonas cavernicola]RJG10907.1 hypothetical protein D3879_14595 [Pseudomonas cavernicola]
MGEFIEERLSVQVDYGADFSEEYAVKISASENGNEYRSLLHPFPKMRCDISYEMRKGQWVIDNVLDLYHRCLGRFAGFRVRNTADYSSNAYKGVPTALDQPMQLVSAGVYQLQKLYGAAGKPTITTGRPVRTVFKPVAGTVLVAIGGVALPSAQWAVDTITGRITLAANKTDTIVGITKAAQAVIDVGTNTFLVGESVVISGVAGMTQINGLRALITAKPDATHITVAINSTAFSTYTSGGTVQTQPVAGEAVTAGFEFDIPCRFDSDLSGITFTTFDVMSAGGIEIIELLNP